MTEDTTTIPANHIEFCRAVAKLAAAAGLTRLGMTFRPAFCDPWRDEVQMRWEDGRHGEDSGKVFITSTVQVHAKVVP